MDKRSIFGLEPDQLDELLSAITGDSDGTELEKVKSSSPDDANPSKKSQLAGITASLHGSIEQPGSQIGRYKLLHVLGEGGMGIVYLAEQKHPIRRQVALKVIKPGMDSKRVLARFDAERQALALLDHPNIAHVYDAGMTETGRPFFVMEHVRGLPITEHCDHYRLTIEQRLKLFQQVCHAVQHAHQKGIIHRDIKPSNILVTIHEDQAIPKIIDFGVAKAVLQPLTDRTLYTEQGQLFGTPEYMSPEQADMANEDIDIRSDIYSLGVMLYVLLTGVLPFDSDTLREGGIENIRKTIRETDPRTPSTRLAKLGDEAIKLAKNRRIEIHTLARHLKKELEWMPLKAMRKDRSERYRSASELADDIENYMRGAPLIAGPPSNLYRLKKFVRRNRALVTGVAAVLTVLIAGIIVSTLFALGQARARTETQVIAEFLKNDVLASAYEARAGEATVGYILDAASKKLEGKFNGQPLTEASVRETLGGTYDAIGESAKAEQEWLRALHIYQHHHGEDHPATIRAMEGLYWVYDHQERHFDAERLRTDTLQIGRRIYGDKYEHDPILAHTYYHLGRYKEAESLYDKALEPVRRAHGADYVLFYPMDACNLARVYSSQGRYDEAEKLFLGAFKNAEWDAESRWRLCYTTDLANMYTEQGRCGEAESLLAKTLATQRQVLGDKYWATLESMCALARLCAVQARYDEAESLLDEALEIGRNRLRQRHPLTLRFVNALAVLRTKQKQYDEAEVFFNEALQGRKQELGDDHPATLESKNDLAVLYKEQCRFDETEPLLLEALEGRRLKLGDTHPHTIESLNNLIDLYQAWGKPEQASPWRAKLPQPTSEPSP